MRRLLRLVSDLADRTPPWWDRPWVWRLGWGREDDGYVRHSVAGALYDLHGALVALDPGWAQRGTREST